MKNYLFILFLLIASQSFSQINSPNGNNLFYYNGAADVTFRYADRGTGGRVLVHDVGNILTLNFANDFTGGTRIGNNVFFKDNGNSFINSGNFGIGTTTPDYKLTVNGNFKVLNGGNQFSYNGAADILFKYADRGTGGRAFVHASGNILALNFASDFTGGTIIGNDVFFKDGGNSYISSGNFGIGTKSPAYKLDVNGTIHAKEVKVDLNFPADYVFKSDYNLMPLSDVEQFINTNSHLPEIPSASEIKENGFNIGDMQNKLLQKIEELTLYTIEQNKKIEQQNKKINELEKQNERLLTIEEKIAKLESMEKQ